MSLNIRDHHLKTDYYKQSLVYNKHTVTTDQKSMTNTQDIKNKESKHNTIIKSSTYKRKEKENKKGTEKKCKNN